VSTAARIRDALLVVGEYTAEALYGLVHSEWRRTGATDEEAHRRLPGDELIPQPNWAVTRAQTINAGTSEVWPWIVQMGYGRGGFYGDFPWWRDPDRHLGTRSSAHAILAQYQHLHPEHPLRPGGSDEPRARTV
jgi:hypothetical protein